MAARSPPDACRNGGRRGPHSLPRTKCSSRLSRGTAAVHIGTLVKLVRVLIMKFSTEANITPEMSELVFNLLKPVIKWQELAVKKEALGLERQKFQRTTVELFLKWYVDEEAKKIVTLNVPNQEKTERLGQRMFGELWK